MLAQHQLSMIKGKRSKRPRSASPLLLTITTSSADLSSGAVGDDGVISDVSPSSSSEFAHSATTDEEEADMANCLILLAKGKSSSSSAVTAGEAYQCKTCSKSFSSFQALGGHRASHKRPSKPTTLEEKKHNLMREKQMQESFRGDDSTYLSLQISNRSPASTGSKTRVHECSICGAEFGSGQALGGHMRRHRPITVAAASGGGVKTARNVLSLDLNLPAPEDDQESKFPFATKEQVIVFAASPLIDCHY